MDIIEIDKKLQNEFNLRKIYNEKVAFFNKNKVNSIKEYKELDTLEREIVFRLGKISLKENAKDEYLSLSNELNKISENKTKILEKIGLKKEDLLPKYNCKKCKDSGFINGKMCNCYKKARNIEIIKQCGFNFEQLSDFDSVDEQLFKNDKHFEDFSKLKTKLKKWCENYPSVKKINIVIFGATGIGKTFLIKCMAKSLIEKNMSVCFMSAFEMNNLFLKYHTTFNEKKEQIFIPFMESDILFIDDLGSEPNLKNVTNNYLYLLLSERERFNKPTIVTSNLPVDSIANRYGERVLSRITDKTNSFIFNLEGDDLRVKK